MIAKLCAWVQAKDGVTGIEYSLIAVGIGLVTLAGTSLLGDQLSDLFNVQIFEDMGDGALQ